MHARLDGLVAEIGELGGHVAGCGGWAGGQRAGALRRLDRVAGALAAVRGALLMAEQRAAQTSAGDRDYIATRARVARTGLGEARREVRQAEALDALPAVADAVRGGDMPVAHLDALARTAAGASDRAREALSRPDVQQTLVRWAGHQSLKEFAGSAARLVASFDPDALDRSAEAQYAARYLHLTHGQDGTFLKGRLDRVAGETLRVALASVQQAPDDQRTKAQADADALVAVAERALAGMAGVKPRRTGGDGLLLPDAEQDAADARVSGVANRPTVSILVPADTFAALTSGVAGTSGVGGERSAAVEPATLEDGTPVAMTDVARVLCDSVIGRMVLDAESVPLDLGRSERLFTAAQRRATIVRDRACAWNGCDVPAAWCEVHHIRWWDRDVGPTDLDNGVLLCSHHITRCISTTSRSTGSGQHRRARRAPDRDSASVSRPATASAREAGRSSTRRRESGGMTSNSRVGACLPRSAEEPGQCGVPGARCAVRGARGQGTRTVRACLSTVASNSRAIPTMSPSTWTFWGSWERTRTCLARTWSM